MKQETIQRVEEINKESHEGISKSLAYKLETKKVKKSYDY